MPQSDSYIDSSDEYLFLSDDSSEKTAFSTGKWKLLIVDDEPDVHSVTKMVLADFSFQGKVIEFYSAFSGKEALDIISRVEDLAVVFLDVVMETDSAGLDVARKIRSELKNKLIRIILRTGQPGAAPEHEVITRLDINDYKHKTELTAQKMATSVTTALRSYRDLKTIEENRISLARLAMSVAHQIRNRTMTISGFANMAERRIGEDPTVKEYLKTVSHEAGRLESIVAGVSEYASIDTADRSVVNVKESMKVLFDKVSAYAFEKKVELKYSLDGKCYDLVCNSDHFFKLVSEVFKNSIDFCIDKKIDLEVSLMCDLHNCQLSFTDNGMGIAPGELPFVFDPLYTSKTDGVGMGLSIAKRIASEYGWDIHIESECGRGTKVFIIIPSGLGLLSGQEN